MKTLASVFGTFWNNVRYPKRHSSLTIWLLLLLLLIPIFIIVPEFFRPRNIANVLVQMVPLGIVAIGQTFVILGGGIDLSVGSQISLISVIASSLMSDNPVNVILVILLCLCFGCLFGLLNGLLLKFFSIPPLITTLSTGYLFQGIAFALHDPRGGYIPAALRNILFASRGMLSVPFALLLLIFSIAWFVLYKTPRGRYVFALGGNAEALNNSGINPGRVRIMTYVVSGLLCAVVGIFLAVRLRSGSAHYGTDYTLLSITATVVGGTSMIGGLGSLSGTFAGTILVSMLNNVLNNISFRFNLQSAFYRDIITGLILVTAMFFYRKRE